MLIFNSFDIIVVPFPFVDSGFQKNRPAIILSSSEFNKENNHYIAAMITSALHRPWALDHTISDLSACGLTKASLIRLKLFTLDHRFIVKKIGHLGLVDKKAIKKNLKFLLKDVL